MGKTLLVLCLLWSKVASQATTATGPKLLPDHKGMTQVNISSFYIYTSTTLQQETINLYTPVLTQSLLLKPWLIVLTTIVFFSGNALSDFEIINQNSDLLRLCVHIDSKIHTKLCIVLTPLEGTKEFGLSLYSDSMGVNEGVRLSLYIIGTSMGM